MAATARFNDTRALREVASWRSRIARERREQYRPVGRESIR